jgi:GTP cyclohydrolase FolE2
VKDSSPEASSSPTPHQSSLTGYPICPSNSSMNQQYCSVGTNNNSNHSQSGPHSMQQQHQTPHFQRSHARNHGKGGNGGHFRNQS